MIEIHSCISAGNAMRVWTLLLWRKEIQNREHICFTVRHWNSLELVIKGSVRETEEQRVFASTGERPTGVSGLLGRRESNSHLPGCNNTNTSNTSLLSTKHQTKAWGCSHEQETVLSQQGWRPSKLAFRTDWGNHPQPPAKSQTCGTVTLVAVISPSFGKARSMSVLECSKTMKILKCTRASLGYCPLDSHW